MVYLDPVLARVYLNGREQQRTYRLGEPIPVDTLPQRAGRRSVSWPARSMRWLLARLGSQLIAVGERLERQSLPERRPELISYVKRTT
jgi:hypothetical protein